MTRHPDIDRCYCKPHAKNGHPVDGLRLPAEPEAPDPETTARNSWGVRGTGAFASQPVPTPEPPADPHDHEFGCVICGELVHPASVPEAAPGLREALDNLFAVIQRSDATGEHRPALRMAFVDVHRAALDATPPSALDVELIRAEFQRFYDFVADADPAIVDAWHFTENVRYQEAARLATSTDTPGKDSQ